MTLGPAIFDCHVLALDIAGLFQTLAEWINNIRSFAGRSAAEEPDYWQRWLLRAHGERPSDCCAAENGDELAPLHSITSSARLSSFGGISRPSALAVLRLITSSNLGGGSPGAWAGL